MCPDVYDDDLRDIVRCLERLNCANHGGERLLAQANTIWVCIKNEKLIKISSHIKKLGVLNIVTN